MIPSVALVGLATTALISIGVGAGSAVLPVVNAEAYVVAASLRLDGEDLVVGVLAVAVGQTLGKLVLFESARRGVVAHGARAGVRSGTGGDRVGRRRRNIDGWRRTLSSRRSGPGLVLTSAALGLPPLAIVSLAAGAAGQRRSQFATACLVGRTARFGALAAPVALSIPWW